MEKQYLIYSRVKTSWPGNTSEIAKYNEVIKFHNMMMPTMVIILLTNNKLCIRDTTLYLAVKDKLHCIASLRYEGICIGPNLFYYSDPRLYTELKRQIDLICAPVYFKYAVQFVQWLSCLMLILSAGFALIKVTLGI